MATRKRTKSSALDAKSIFSLATVTAGIIVLAIAFGYIVLGK